MEKDYLKEGLEGETPKIIGEATAANGVKSMIANTSGGKKVIDNHDGTITVGKSQYAADGKGGCTQVG